MKTEFQAKFLQHLLQKKKENEGFTLIELLVVIIIIGILAAIALPSFLNQANKARESESKQYVGSMNRTQQAYYLEKQAFTSDLSQLGLGIKSTTSNFTYTITAATLTGVVNFSTATNTNAVRSHAGAVQLGDTSATATASEKTTLATLCQMKKAGQTAPGSSGVAFGASTAGPSCNSANWEELGK